MITTTTKVILTLAVLLLGGGGIAYASGHGDHGTKPPPYSCKAR